MSIFPPLNARRWPRSKRADEAALEAVRVAALGKKGSISALLTTLGKLRPDERKEQGAAINALKDQVTEALTARRECAQAARRSRRSSSARRSTSRCPCR